MAAPLVFFFAAIDIETEISLEIETKYIAGSNAFDPKEKVEGKVSKRLSYFRDLSKSGATPNRSRSALLLQDVV